MGNTVALSRNAWPSGPVVLGTDVTATLYQEDGFTPLPSSDTYELSVYMFAKELQAAGLSPYDAVDPAQAQHRAPIFRMPLDASTSSFRVGRMPASEGALVVVEKVAANGSGGLTRTPVGNFLYTTYATGPAPLPAEASVPCACDMTLTAVGADGGPLAAPSCGAAGTAVPDVTFASGHPCTLGFTSGALTVDGASVGIIAFADPRASEAVGQALSMPDFLTLRPPLSEVAYATGLTSRLMFVQRGRPLVGRYLVAACARDTAAPSSVHWGAWAVNFVDPLSSADTAASSQPEPVPAPTVDLPGAGAVASAATGGSWTTALALRAAALVLLGALALLLLLSQKRVKPAPAPRTNW